MLSLLFGCGAPEDQDQIATPQQQTEPASDEETSGAPQPEPLATSETVIYRIVADAGYDVVVFEGEQVTLTGAGTHYRGPGTLHFEWSQTQGRRISIQEGNSIAMSFTAPQVEGTTMLQFTLTVDNDDSFAQDSVEIKVLNLPGPHAVAEVLPADRVTEGELVRLDASDSVGFGSSELRFHWTQVSGPEVVLDHGASATASFIAPLLTGDAEELVFEVLVSQGGYSDTARVSVIVNRVGDLSSEGDVGDDFDVEAVSGGGSSGGSTGSGSVPVDGSGDGGSLGDGSSCGSDLDCDDGLFCNGSEECACESTETGAACSCVRSFPPCPAQACNEANDSCEECASDGDCADDLPCNGSETCRDGWCIPIYPCPPGEICDEENNVCIPYDGTIYYVAPDGDDSNPGSEAFPFATIQHAANVVYPSDMVYIKAGTYYAPDGDYLTPILNIVTGGIEGMPIRFQNFQNDIVILDAEAVTSVSNNGHRRGIHIGPAFDYIEIVGLVVKNAFREGILVSGENVLIENCIIEDCGLNPNNAESAGIKFDYSKFLTVRRCVTRHCYNGFGARNAEDSYIEDCLSYRNGITTSGDVIYPENANGFQTGVARAGSDRARFVRCIAFGNADDGWDMSHNRDGTLDGCIAFNQNDLSLPGGDGGGFKVGNDQNEPEGSGRECRRLLIRSCVAINNIGIGGIDNRDAWYGKFYNNIAYGNAQFGYGFNGEFVTGLNNIGMNNGTADVASATVSPLLIDYNCWEDGSRANGEGPNSITADPQFVNPDGVIDTSWQSGYALDDVRGILPTITNIRSQVLSNFAIQPGSPCIDVGSFATFTAQAGSSTAQIPVEDDPRERFRVGDVIQIEGAGTATIQSMTGTAITTDASLTFSAGAGVHLPWNGARPDMGAIESP